MKLDPEQKRIITAAVGTIAIFLVIMTLMLVAARVFGIGNAQ